jgi:hypothetical protein
MYKLSNDLQMKAQPITTNFINPEIKRKQTNEEIKNKYYELYKPSTDLQKKISHK